MSSRENLVLKRVRRFEELEREFLRFTYEVSKPLTTDEAKAFIGEAFQIAAEAFSIKNEILDEFQELSELRINDNNALRLLDSIRQGKSFNSILFYESIGKMINARTVSAADKAVTSTYDVWIEKFDDLFSDFHSWFDLAGYYFDKTIIGPLISSSKVPDHLIRYFDELKETFAFGQYMSSIALCRALLEMALYEKLSVSGAFKSKDAKNIAARKYNLNDYIDLARCQNIMSDGACDIAHKIRKSANIILHTKDKGRTLNRKEALEIIIDTVRIAENLYR